MNVEVGYHPYQRLDSFLTYFGVEIETSKIDLRDATRPYNGKIYKNMFSRLCCRSDKFECPNIIRSLYVPIWSQIKSYIDFKFSKLYTSSKNF